jgi:DNA-binding beta-propeller fold protein YncE
MVIKRGIKIALRFALLSSAFVVFAQGVTDIGTLNATQEMRVGLEAYNRMSFNEAILALEQALSYKPGEPLILDWLGKAYYRSGLEENALRLWHSAAESYPPASSEAVLINSRIDVVRNRRSLFPTMNNASRYIESGFFAGKQDKFSIFSQPTAILPCDDGAVWAVAYGSNEILRIDVNGLVRIRQRGPLAGFDRPFDIARGLDGRIYVSEFRGGRVSILSDTGQWISYIGQKGLGDGMLLGPAALAIDEEGYIYVCEFGNRRISKFDPDGVFITSFGKKDDVFPGFLSPTGIACKNGIIYAADSIAKTIYMFDGNGMYLGILTNNGLNAPESIRVFPDGSLLIADTNRLLLLDTDSTIIKELTAPGNSRIRYIGADLDKNGGILAANFNENEITVLSPMNDVASGLFVQIERIYSEEFPKVYVEVSVQDANRKPIIGLDKSNFLLTENGVNVNSQELLDVGNAADTADISVLIERSDNIKSSDISEALRDIKAATGNITNIVSATETPILERSDNLTGSYTPRWRFDLGLRLSATSLIPLSKKRAVVFISSGTLGELSFEQYGLNELAAYMANNGIVFYCILVGGSKPADEISYLCTETGGKAIHLYRAQGIGNVLKSLSDTPSGTYSFSYQSGLSTEFGRAFLKISTEVQLLERSGRDEAGYFVPLE